MSHYPDAAFLTSANRANQFVADSGAEVAFAGRSNAGKSSAINTIVNQRDFARTSKSPGRTQLINFFQLGQDRRLVDLPGYGYAKVPKAMQIHWGKLIEHYFSQRESLTGMFVIVDIRRGLGDYDRQMLAWAGQLDRPAHVLLTKADKLRSGQAAKALLTARKELEDRASVQLFSALKRDGADEARTVLNQMLG
jgi:GTP-binding protein